MFADVTLTETLARIFGLYMAAAGVGLLADPKAFDGIVEQFRASSALSYMTAVLVFSLGAVTVSLHNDWSGWPAIIVSLIGWGALLEGVLMLAVRRGYIGLVARIPTPPTVMRGFGVFTVLLGIALLYAGFMM